jgi:RimJ/RimL family protein N-acetyltransferase
MTAAPIVPDSPDHLRTERLLLRRWQDSDREPFAALNADRRVMEFLPALLSRKESDAMIDRLEAHFDQHGFGFWAVETDDGSCAGFVGLSVPRFETSFTPCVEIGWRLGAQHWGRGYATEGAQAALAFGFERVGLKEILSFTVPSNIASRRVMEKIGMTCDRADDFDHPSLAIGHRLRRHVLHRAVAPPSP